MTNRKRFYRPFYVGDRPWFPRHYQCLKPYEAGFLPVQEQTLAYGWRRSHAHLVFQAIQAVVAVVGIHSYMDNEDACRAAGWVKP